jgi:hypothetical protein
MGKYCGQSSLDADTTSTPSSYVLLDQCFFFDISHYLRDFERST